MIGLINVGRALKVLIPSTTFPKIVSFGKYRVVLSLTYTWGVGANIINLVEATAIMPVNTAAVLDLGQKRPRVNGTSSLAKLTSSASTSKIPDWETLSANNIPVKAIGMANIRVHFRNWSLPLGVSPLCIPTSFGCHLPMSLESPHLRSTWRQGQCLPRLSRLETNHPTWYTERVALLPMPHRPNPARASRIAR
jgi:hypothetical protein